MLTYFNQRKAKAICSFSLLLMCQLLVGQNLLLNPGFEEYNSCPVGLADYTPLNWTVPTGGTTDYLHECGATAVSVPSNFVGFQESNTGEAYSGLITYYKGLDNYREYIQAELTSPTIKGACYQLTIVYSSADFKGDSDGLGMLLSDGIPSSYLDQPSQMAKTTVIESKTIWNTLTTEYVSPGGETHVTIGNFENDDNTSFFMPPDGPVQDFVYYYIDFVGVIDLSTISEDIDVDLGEDLKVCSSDFPLTLSSNYPDACNVWSTGGQGNSIEVNDFGEYYLRVNIDCEYGVDTIQITEIEEPVLEIEDITICEDQDQTILLDEELGAFLWDDGSTGAEYTLNQEGYYGVTLTYQCGEVQEEFEVEEIKKISVPEIEDFMLCETDIPYTLDLSVFDDEMNQFLWSDGSDSPIMELANEGVYQLQIFNDCFSQNLDFEVSISTDFPEIVDFIDTIACTWEEKIINLGFNNAYFEWDDGTTNSFNLVNGPGIYSVTVSNYCRTQVFEFEIHEAVEPEFDLGDDLSICPGDSILIVSPTGGDISWNNGTYADQIWVKDEGMIIGNTAGFCSILSDTIELKIDGMAPQISMPDSLTICLGDTLLISASQNIAGVDFIWNTGSESSEIEVFSAGIYVVAAENNCGLVKDSIVIILEEEIFKPDLLDIYEICAGDTLELEIATNATSIEWSTNEMESSISIYEEGTYWLSLMTSCYIEKDTFELVFNDELSNINLGQDIGICSGESAVLEHIGTMGDYLWNTGSEEQIIEVDEVGVYWLQISGVCNMVSDTITVLDLGEAPTVNIGPDISFCEGDTILITVEGEGFNDIIWNTNSIENTIFIYNEGTYIVTGSNVCGSDSDTLEAVFSTELPQINLGLDQIICPGDSILLDVGGVMGDIEWNTGEEGASIYAKEAGIYIATLISSCGESIDSVNIALAEAAPVVNLGDDVSICSGEILEYNLIIDEQTNVIWSNGDEDGMTSYSESEIIWLELSNSCGKHRDSIQLTVIPEIETFTLGEDVTICDEQSYLLESNITQDDVDLEWNTMATEPFIQVTESDEYWLRVSNSCFEFSDSIEINFYTSPEDFDLGPDDTICSGQSIILSENQGESFQYLWQDETTDNDYVVMESGIYSLEISNVCGTVRDDVEIVVLPSEDIKIPLEDHYVLCNGVPLLVDLTSVLANNIIWNDGSTDLVRSIEEAGLYFIEFSNSCIDTLFNFELELKNCLREMIFLPNTFSPNNDGVNDHFLLSFPKNWEISKFDIQIYNRWGEQIYHSENPNFEWDGKFKGNYVNQAVYAFYFELEVEIGGELVLIKDGGSIMILN